MASLKTIARLLKLKELKLVDFSFHRDSTVRLYVKPFKNGCRCPDCDRRCKIVRTRPKLREWRDLSVGGHRLVFCYFPREIHCPTHGRCEENIPWAAPHSRITYRFEHTLLSLCQSMTQKAAAKLLQTAPSTLSDLLHRCIERHRHGHRIRGLRTLGIDEISYHKRHKYATLIYDLDTSKVVWIGKGRGRDTIDRFFTEALSPWQRQQVRAACCDMSASYIGAIREHCPQATLVLDRFHIVKALNEAVDQVRKQAWREASKHDKKAVKGLRWMLYRHSSTRSRADTAALKALEKSNRRIYRAWRLKDEFEQLWNYRSRWGAKRFLKRWTRSALLSRIEPMRRFVGTVRKHLDAVIAYSDTRLTNAISEGINRIAKIVKNRASGFRHLEAFADMIFLTIGDVDIPAQIPRRFRTC